MAIRQEAITFLRDTLGDSETEKIIRLAKKQDQLEAKGRREIQQTFEKIKEKVTQDLINHQPIDERWIYESILDTLVFHSFRTMEQAFKSATVKASSTKRMARRPGKQAMPRSLKDLMKLWDEWRDRKYIPPHERKLAEKVKSTYLKKIRSVWERESEDFRSGKTGRETVVKAIEDASKAPRSRAETIVQTETTRYYNTVRRTVYDQSPDVTHYLFIAIRDRRTTTWCKTRDGLVYEKGSEYLRKETPPCHWNCRSEIVPLTATNPSHLKLIRDKSIQRGNRKPEPLPRGWVAA